MSPATVPHDVDAEEAVVASVLVALDKLPAVRERVRLGDFHDQSCRIVYAAICRLFDEGQQVDQLTITHELDRQHLGSNSNGRTALYEIGGAGWLSRVIAELPTPIGVEGYADIVRRDATYRQLISASAQIADMARQGGPELDEIVRRAGVLIAGVTDKPTAQVEPFTATSLDDLLAEDDDAADGERFITDGDEGAVLTRDSNFAIASATGVGKTNKLLGLSRALCDGSSFLGLAIPEPRRVLYVLLEGSRRNVRRRLSKVWADSTDESRERFTLAMPDRIDLMDPASLTRLDALIAECAPDVLTIDPLRHAHGVDENDNTAMAQVTAVLDGIKARHDCAVVLAHHDRKRPPFTKRDTGTDRVRGATAFTGWLTSCLSLDRDPSGTDRFLVEWTKTRDAEEQLPPQALDFDRATLAFTIADRSADGTVSPDTILTAIWRDGGSARGTDLVRGFVDGAGVGEKAVRTTLRALVAEKRLVEYVADDDKQSSAKSYRLPDEEPVGDES